MHTHLTMCSRHLDAADLYQPENGMLNTGQYVLSADRVADDVHILQSVSRCQHW